MKRISTNLLIVTICTVITFKTLTPSIAGTLSEPFPAAEFHHNQTKDWINSEPLMLDDLKGKVVLLDFWTFDCWNCYRSFPWMNNLEKRLQAKGLQVIGVHTPEFSHEKIRSNIETKVKEFKLRHPIMIDNDFTYWRAMYNKYWPAFYLIDKKSNVRAVFFGETHEGDEQAVRIEKMIEKLLTEPA
ncbi:MAG: redoxin domain-containing protein [Proteobacteria bacterium]|nr:redoxin domain-containing protein [Pseudomonadota bacterium]